MPAANAFLMPARGVFWTAVLATLVTSPVAQGQAMPLPGAVSEADRNFTPEERTNITVYEAVNRSVVNINTKATVATGLFLMEVPSDGAGSGIVLDRQGHVLTNFHVVDGAREIQAVLYDGSSHSARVVGIDPATDVAVLKVEAPEAILHPVAFGTSNDLRVGQRVFAIGNPFGLERTLTTGIISSLNRSLPTRTGRTIKSIIQTDAAINPGNSGGPLVNLRGEVVGLNTAIASNSGGSEGIGFAIPIPMVMFVARQLVEHGTVPRAYLGVALDKRFDQQEAGRLGMVRPVGARVETVTRGAPADLAGIRANDVILEFEGRPIEDDDHLMSMVGMTPLGSTVALVIFRDGERISLTLKVASRKDFE